MRVQAFRLLVAAMAAMASCSGDPAVSDTGLTGTWVREGNRTVSLIALTKLDERYLFRWSKFGADDDFRVRCDWDGRCEEWKSGRKFAEYLFSTRTDPRSGRLLVECHETRLLPKLHEQHFIDELVVEPGGKVLWSYTIERDGETFESGKGPQRSFMKVADSIADPPRRRRS
jgi:hypothetical protein